MFYIPATYSTLTYTHIYTLHDTYYIIDHTHTHIRTHTHTHIRTHTLIITHVADIHRYHVYT